MKKIIIFINFSGIIIFYTSCAIRKSEALMQRDFTPKNEHVSNGEKVYMANCEKCHPGGESGLGPTLVGNPAPQLAYRFQMRHGIGVMPSFKKDEISKSDLHDISKYLRALKRF